jgi:hypothetical protein
MIESVLGLVVGFILLLWRAWEYAATSVLALVGLGTLCHFAFERLGWYEALGERLTWRQMAAAAFVAGLMVSAGRLFYVTLWAVVTPEGAAG